MDRSRRERRDDRIVSHDKLLQYLGSVIGIFIVSYLSSQQIGIRNARSSKVVWKG